MKKALFAMAAMALVSGTASAAERLDAQALDQVTAGTVIIGNVQSVAIYGVGLITGAVVVKGNLAGAGADALALGKNTFTDTKAYAYTTPYSSSSTSIAVAGTAPSYSRRAAR